MKRVLAALALAMGVSVVWAQATPVGVWKTIDDDGKTEKSVVRITDAGGKLNGRIETLFDATKKDAVCDKCSDERKDKPLVGLMILRDVAKDTEDQTLWSGGNILDPNNGKVYKSKLKLVDNGAKLDVRGYIGVPMLGRTQTWIRAE